MARSYDLRLYKQYQSALCQLGRVSKLRTQLKGIHQIRQANRVLLCTVLFLFFLSHHQQQHPSQHPSAVPFHPFLFSQPGVPGGGFTPSPPPYTLQPLLLPSAPYAGNSIMLCSRCKGEVSATGVASPYLINEVISTLTGVERGWLAG